VNLHQVLWQCRLAIVLQTILCKNLHQNVHSSFSLDPFKIFVWPRYR
jgi:hypothetical protein